MEKSYIELFEQHYNGNGRDNLVHDFHTFVQGETLVGEYVGSEMKQIQEDTEPVRSYTVITDDGPKSFLLGGATDKQIDGYLTPGDLLSVTFKGKQSIKGGSQQVNKFDIFKVPAEDWQSKQKR